MLKQSAPRVSSPAHLLLLAVTCILWGAGFPVSQAALDAGLSPLMVTLLRFGLAALTMLPFCFSKLGKLSFAEVRIGLGAGALLFCAFWLQIAGLELTTPSSNAFITSTNVVFVPFLSWLILRKRPSKLQFFSVFLCFLGLFLLNFDFQSGFSWNPGDFLTLLCAFSYACHIAYLGRFSQKLDSTVLSFQQFCTTAALSLLMLLIRSPGQLMAAEAVGRAAGPILFLGLFATGLAFFAQTFAQSRISPTQASLIMSTESVTGCIFSVLMGYEPISLRMLAGGAIILCAAVLPELRFARRGARKKEI